MKQPQLQRLTADTRIGQGRHIWVEKRPPGTFPLHWHNYFEIEVILSGSGQHTLNGHSYTVHQGDVYLLTPVDFHEMVADESMELYNISFDETCVSENTMAFLSSDKVPKPFLFTADEYARFVNATELLLHECEHNGPCTVQLLEYLLSFFMQRGTVPTSSSVDRTDFKGIPHAIAYMELHFREKISLPQLAALSGYHPTYFSELFRKVTGETYIERLTSLRVNYARLLLSKGFTVSEACFGSGFGSLSNFLTAFKAAYAMSPNEYRKQVGVSC